tara:strand:- start:384 stop:662 length:279 start_codon:yes stop_codon:yes gene_type:complete
MELLMHVKSTLKDRERQIIKLNDALVSANSLSSSLLMKLSRMIERVETLGHQGKTDIKQETEELVSGIDAHLMVEERDEEPSKEFVQEMRAQ